MSLFLRLSLVILPVLAGSLSWAIYSGVQKDHLVKRTRASLQYSAIYKEALDEWCERHGRVPSQAEGLEVLARHGLLAKAAAEAGVEMKGPLLPDPFSSRRGLVYSAASDLPRENATVASSGPAPLYIRKSNQEAVVVFAGPDERIDYLVSGTVQPYDPTNGIKSAGDIVVYARSGTSVASQEATSEMRSAVALVPPAAE